MDEKYRSDLRELRSLDSEEAVKWLLSRYPSDDGNNIGKALILMPHRSWSRKSQIILANYYLSNISHNGIQRALECFCVFMSVTLLSGIIWQFVKEDYKKMDFLLYNLSILHNNCKNKKDIVAVDDLESKLKQGLSDLAGRCIT